MIGILHEHYAVGHNPWTVVVAMLEPIDKSSTGPATCEDVAPKPR